MAAHRTYAGELLCVIAPDNLASHNVCRKLGFAFWQRASIDGDIRNLHIKRMKPHVAWTRL